MPLQNWIVLLSAYLLGSIPSAQLISRSIGGVDIRKIGDGNMGAKNTFLSLGALAGVFVLIADIGKGAIAILLAHYLSASDEIKVLAGMLVVVGHIFPVFLQFKGGHGMATLVGVFSVLFPLQTMFALIIFGLALLIARQWDWSCYIGFGSLLILILIFGFPVKWIFYSILLMCLLFLRMLRIRIQSIHKT